MARKKPAVPPQKPPKPAPTTYALPSGGWRGFPRVISVLVLIAVVMLVAALFFRVIASFIVPLFLAAVLVVVFEPLHKWVASRLPGRPKLAAAATTTLIVFLVLMPFGVLGWKATIEAKHLYRILTTSEQEAVAQENGEAAESGAENTLFNRLKDKLAPLGGIDGIEESIEKQFGLKENSVDLDPQLQSITANIVGRATEFGLASLKAIALLVIGILIMTFALYYFLADGPAMLQTLMHLSPLDDDQEKQLLEEFSEVSRAVVVASIVAAVVQGLLGGIGYYFVLPEGAPLVLLTVITMLLAIVPFVGATAVWIPVAIWVWFLAPNGTDEAGVAQVGNPLAAILLSVWGVVAVSGVDNIIKPFVLGGQSKLHPLLALLSVLGGVQVLGPIGILVGPMLIAFLQALLGMLRKELDEMEQEQPGPTIEVQIPADTPITVVPEQIPPAT